MNEQHPLVDHENVQPSIKDLLKLVPKHPDVQLFRGPNQIKRAKQLQAAHIGLWCLFRYILLPQT